MLSGDITPGIPQWRTEITVNGTVRDVQSIDWDTEMTGDLPDQVVAMGGVSGTDGTIQWAAQDPVTTRPVSPWAKTAGWPPSSGDRVRCRVTDGVTWWTRWTGVIDKTSGDPTSGFQSTIIDYRDKLTGLFTMEALLRYAPPVEEGAGFRAFWLTSWHVLTQALRSRGIYNVPSAEARCEFSIPLQGSVHPEHGTVTDVEGLTDYPQFSDAPWGHAAGSFRATIIPRLGYGRDQPLQLTMMLGDNHAGTAYVEVQFGTGRVRLSATTARSVSARYVDASGESTSVADLTSTAMNGADIVQLLVKNGQWTLRNDQGQEATGSRTLPTGALLQGALYATTDARLAGVQVSRPDTVAREFRSLSFAPSMRYAASLMASTMNMSPALRARSVPDLVNEILSATLTASWWDEEGVLRLRASDRLHTTGRTSILTTLDDITSLQWAESARAVRSSVDVTWKQANITLSALQRVELWRGRNDSLTTGEVNEDFVTPESGIEWFGVDRRPRNLTGTEWSAYNLPRESYTGVWFSNSNGDEVSTAGGDVRIVAEDLYADSMKITTTVVATPPGTEANTSTPPEAVGLRNYRRGEAMPVIRGFARGEWIDETTSTDAGPPSAPVLVHNLGYWGGMFSTDTVAERIGAFLAEMVSAPQPTITGMGVVYDPRRQLGDIYLIRSEWLRIELRVLVVGISESHGPDGAHQTLTVRVTDATPIGTVTYDDLAAAWGSSNYTGLQAAWSSLTYSDFVADPLKGAPE